MIRMLLFALALTISADAFAQDVQPVATPQLGSRQEAASSRDTSLIDKHDANITAHGVHDQNRANHAEAPAGATARCRDGTYSFSQDHRDACSHHGGVQQWLNVATALAFSVSVALAADFETG